VSFRALVLASAVVLVAGVSPPSAATATGPTPAQVRAAVARAEKSKDLWATINACNIPSTNPRGEKLIGVRVQMPALGFPSRLYKAVEIEYWSPARKRFLKTDARYPLKSFAIAVHAPQQSGVSFAFTRPPAGGHFLLRGVATLEWRIGTRVLGRVVRSTGHGYKHVDFSRPPGYNEATCTITP
jgi:hypothetical protein